MGGAGHSWAAARAHDGAPARELPVHGGHLPRRRGGPAGAVHRDGPGAPESTRDASGAELLPRAVKRVRPLNSCDLKNVQFIGMDCVINSMRFGTAMPD